MRSWFKGAVPDCSWALLPENYPVFSIALLNGVPDQATLVPDRSWTFLTGFPINSFKINTVPDVVRKIQESVRNGVKYRNAAFNDFNDLAARNGFQERAAKSLKNLRSWFLIYPLTGIGAYNAQSPRGEGRGA